mmetsp:Transcript_7427/g.15932  ORF Transcript_7427/g.15932 Transcript_7427/m.15932 type:complete len:210 (-) Transcript_7427:5679-6308(-)
MSKLLVDHTRFPAGPTIAKVPSFSITNVAPGSFTSWDCQTVRLQRLSLQIFSTPFTILAMTTKGLVDSLLQMLFCWRLLYTTKLPSVCRLVKNWPLSEVNRPIGFMTAPSARVLANPVPVDHRATSTPEEERYKTMDPSLLTWSRRIPRPEPAALHIAAPSAVCSCSSPPSQPNWAAGPLFTDQSSPPKPSEYSTLSYNTNFPSLPKMA